MADASEELVRAPGATITGAGTLNPVVDSWNLGTRIDDFPSLDWVTHTGFDGDVLLMLGTDLIDLAASLQERTFANEPELFSASLEDGINEPFQVDGHMLTPSLTASPTSAGISFAGIHKAAYMSVFRPSIYDRDRPAAAKDEDEISTSRISYRILEILDEMIEAWEEKPDRLKDEEEEEIHELNKTVYHMVWQLLEDSSPTTRLPELRALYPHDHKEINNWIRGVLREPGGDFFTAILRMGSQFRFSYRPPHRKSDVGLLVNHEFLYEEDEESRTSGVVVQFTATTGMRALLPVTRVVVEGMRAGITKDTAPPEDEEKPEDALVETEIAAYPEKPLPGAGRTLTVPIPDWMPAIILPAENKGILTQEEMDCESVAAGGGVTPEEARARDNNKKRFEAYLALNRRHARMIWLDQITGPCRANMFTDLDLDWETGKRYRVSMETEEGPVVLFSGLLESATHSCAVRGEGGNASSSLSFTHIGFGEFALQGLVD